MPIAVIAASCYTSGAAWSIFSRDILRFLMEYNNHKEKTQYEKVVKKHELLHFGDCLKTATINLRLWPSQASL